MRTYFLRISVLLLFMTIHQQCIAQTSLTTDCTGIHIPQLTDIRYRAAIDVVNKHLSGILIFKTQEDSSVRAVFMNEIGATFFDISFTSTTYIFHSIMESMDKKAVKRTLAKDLGMILVRGIYSSMKNYSDINEVFEFRLKAKGKVKYQPAKNCVQYPIIENYGRRRKVVTIKQKYIENESMPDSIFVQHHTVNFTISLIQMNAAE